MPLKRRSTLPADRHLTQRRRPLTVVATLVVLAALVTEGAPSWWSTYRIRSGDTLTSIAARYDTSISALRKANGMPGNSYLIYAGQALRVPAGKAAAPPRTKAPSRGGSASTRVHVVRAGETLSGIAARHGTTVAAVAARNGIRDVHRIRVGQRIRLGGPAAAPAAPKPSAPPSTRAQKVAASKAALARRSVPSRSATRQLVATIARQQGVDPNLAMAIAWQESGFNQRAVSYVNAIGTMQVLPSTGDWVSSIYGRRLDLLDTRDNITAGVVLLRWMRTQVPLSTAIAGYYQGLWGVQKYGMYPSTKRYVANVLSLRARFATGWSPV